MPDATRDIFDFATGTPLVSRDKLVAMQNFVGQTRLIGATVDEATTGLTSTGGSVRLRVPGIWSKRLTAHLIIGQTETVATLDYTYKLQQIRQSDSAILNETTIQANWTGTQSDTLYRVSIPVTSGVDSYLRLGVYHNGGSGSWRVRAFYLYASVASYGSEKPYLGFARSSYAPLAPGVTVAHGDTADSADFDAFKSDYWRTSLQMLSRPGKAYTQVGTTYVKVMRCKVDQWLGDYMATVLEAKCTGGATARVQVKVLNEGETLSDTFTYTVVAGSYTLLVQVQSVTALATLGDIRATPVWVEVWLSSDTAGQTASLKSMRTYQGMSSSVSDYMGGAI